MQEKIEGQAKVWLENAEVKIKQALVTKAMYVYHTYEPAIYEFCRKELAKFGYNVTTIGGGCGGGATQVKISWEEESGNGWR